MLGGSGSNEEIYKKVLAITNLPNDVVEEMHTFTMSEVEYRLMWARTYLKNFGAVENSKQGIWALTSKGAKMLKSGKIDTKEIKKFTNDKHSSENPESEGVPSAEKKGWREQVADILFNMNPYAFEKLAQRLLRECGFSDVEVTKKSGDGGIDGTGKLRINGIFWLSSVSVIKAKLEHHKSAISVVHWEPISKKAYLSQQVHSPVRPKKRHRAKVNV